MEAYCVAAVQAVSRFIPVSSYPKAKDIINKNIDTHLAMLDMMPHGASPSFMFPKFIVFPEFSLQGFPCGKANAWRGDGWYEHMKATAVDIPGEETDRFAARSVEHDTYIQACVWERDEDFPGHYFESVFITDPKGKVAYVRRRVQLGIAGVTTPSDVYDEYLKKYGPDPIKAFFPTLDTPYGCIGGIMCCEMSAFEVSRALTINGAEVLLHSTMGPESAGRYDAVHYRDAERTVTAAWNMAYVVSACMGPILDSPVPQNRGRGQSQIIGYDGNTLSKVDGNGETIIEAWIDIDSLRKTRLRGWWQVAQLKSKVYESVYQQELTPVNKTNRTQQDVMKAKSELMDNLVKRGVARRPA